MPSAANLILDETVEDKEQRHGELLSGVQLWLCDEMQRQGMTKAGLAADSARSAGTVVRLIKGKNMMVTTLADIAYAMGYQLKLEFEEADV